MIGWCRHYRVAVDVGWILMGKARAGEAHLRPVTSQMNGLVTFARPLVIEVGLRLCRMN